MSTTYDFAHNPVAEENRVKKAHRLARWAFEHHVDAQTIAAAPEATRRAWVRTVGLSSASADTWQATIDALAQLEAWAAEHPDHERAQRAPQVTIEAPADAAETPDEVAPALPISRTAAVDAAQWPRGWAALVKMGPLERTDARCSRCGAHAVTSVPMAGSRDEWRCAGHPPVAGEWGHGLDWTPRDDLAFHPDRPHRCFNTRCAWFVPNQTSTPLSASGLLDERAAAKGKNRAPVHVRQAAREAEERRKAHEKEMRSR